MAYPKLLLRSEAVTKHQPQQVVSIGYHATANQSKFVSDSVQHERALLVIYFSKRKNILTHRPTIKITPAMG